MENNFSTKKRIVLIRLTMLLTGLLLFLFVVSACSKPTTSANRNRTS